jgi:hypothetical protein
VKKDGVMLDAQLERLRDLIRSAVRREHETYRA